MANAKDRHASYATMWLAQFLRDSEMHQQRLQIVKKASTLASFYIDHHGQDMHLLRHFDKVTHCSQRSSCFFFCKCEMASTSWHLSSQVPLVHCNNIVMRVSPAALTPTTACVTFAKEPSPTPTPKKRTSGFMIAFPGKGVLSNGGKILLIPKMSQNL